MAATKRKPAKKSKPLKSQLKGMVIEMEPRDYERLENLVLKYQREVGPMQRIRKIHVIRQLIRCADELDWIPKARA